jgi:hypothetical protein
VSNVITGSHPTRGTIWAAFDPSVHHVAGRVADSRFGARLAPFPDEATARWALKQAGASLAPTEA